MQAAKDDLNENIELAFAQALMQNVLHHRSNENVDALVVTAFQTVGLLSGLVPGETLPELLSILQDDNHPRRMNIDVGPFLFIKSDGHLQVIAVEFLLLHPDLAYRQAAFKYFEAASLASPAWISKETLRLMQQYRAELQLEGVDNWQKGSLVICDALKRDPVLALAGLRQSITANYDEGQSKYFTLLMRPDFKLLGTFRPPVWNIEDQGNEIRAWITEISNRDRFEDVLNEYVSRCGYVPLQGEFAASEMIRQWIEKHPNVHTNWESLIAWTRQSNSPTAIFHAFELGLHTPAFRRSIVGDDMWTILDDLLPIKGESHLKAYCHFFWRLGVHYCRVIESIWPGQHGDRIACIAWWLAHEVTMIVGKDKESLASVEEEIIDPEAKLSYWLWITARTPVVATSLRYATQTNSLWSSRVLGTLSAYLSELPIHSMPPGVKENVADTLRAHAFRSALPAAGVVKAEGAGGTDLQELADFAFGQDKSADFKKLLALRKTFDGPICDLRLSQLSEDKVDEEFYMTLTCLRDAVLTSSAFDNEISTWLRQLESRSYDTSKVSSLLFEDIVLEWLFEFHQRTQPEWATRLPHLFAFAIELSEDERLVKKLCPYVFFFSLNSGIVSPIERLMASHWNAVVRDQLSHWRENLMHIAPHVDPWVISRIRAASATISRLIGPRRIPPAQ